MADRARRRERRAELSDFEQLARSCGFILDDWQRRVLVELLPAPAPRRRRWENVAADAVTLGCLLGMFALGGLIFAEWWDLL